MMVSLSLPGMCVRPLPDLPNESFIENVDYFVVVVFLFYFPEQRLLLLRRLLSNYNHVRALMHGLYGEGGRVGSPSDHMNISYLPTPFASLSHPMDALKFSHCLQPLWLFL